MAFSGRFRYGLKEYLQNPFALSKPSVQAVLRNYYSKNSSSSVSAGDQFPIDP